LCGDVDLLCDADGAAHLLDGDVVGEEAVEDAEDELGALAIVLVGLDEGLTDGELLDPGGGWAVGEAETVLGVGAGGFHLLRGCGEGEVLAVAEDGEGGGLTLVVLEIGEESVDGVGGEVIDADELVAGLETGALGG